MFKNQKGISLIQVTIAAGMLGGLALVSTQLLSNMKSGQTGVEALSDELSMKSEIQMILRNKDFCRVSFAGLGPEGNPDVPVVFKKDEQDGENDTDGINVALYFAQKDNMGDETRNLKFTTFALDQVNGMYGKVKILDMYLRFNNGIGFNYAANSQQTDVAELHVNIEKRISLKSTQEKLLRFPVNLYLSTDASSDTTILGCSKSSSNSSNLKLIARHSQTNSVPDCPAGWDSVWTGYSYLMGNGGASSATFSDLGKPSSCMENFRHVMFNECKSNQCDFQTGDDYTYWLGTSTSNSPSSSSITVNRNRVSRCRVCSKPTSTVFTKHSQTTTVPTCPAGFTSIWDGYSFGFATGGDRGGSYTDLNSPGSCLSRLIPDNFLECNVSGCRGWTPDDFTYWLSTRTGGDIGSTTSVSTIRNLTSRCSVCAAD